jgi:hypothetical protein
MQSVRQVRKQDRGRNQNGKTGKILKMVCHVRVDERVDIQKPEYGEQSNSEIQQRR